MWTCCKKLYKLIIVWLASLVGGFHMLLPAHCPVEFASMQEHLAEVTMELLLFASYISKALKWCDFGELISTMFEKPFKGLFSTPLQMSF